MKKFWSQPLHVGLEDEDQTTIGSPDGSHIIAKLKIF